MSIGISFKFDQTTENKIREIRTQLKDAGLPSGYHEPHIAPHITAAVADPKTSAVDIDRRWVRRPWKK